VDTETGREHRLTHNPGVDGSPAWSPDGRRIACGCQRGGNFDIYLLNVDGSRERKLTKSPAVQADPTWSPDGSKIAFESKRAGSSEIDVMTSNGDGVKRLTRNGSYPSWSPDGRRIAFVRDGGIYAMNADGSEARQVARGLFPGWLSSVS